MHGAGQVVSINGSSAVAKDGGPEQPEWGSGGFVATLQDTQYVRSALAREMGASTRRRFVDVALNAEYADLHDVAKYFDHDFDIGAAAAVVVAVARVSNFVSLYFHQSLACV